MHPRLVGIARKSGLTVLLVLTFLISGELTARLDDRIRLQVPIWANPDHDHDLILHDEIGIRGRPNGRFKKWRLNSFGFRGPEMTVAPAPGCSRVVILGASETFGLYESDEREYPAQLRAILSHHGCYEMVNAAVVGLTVRGIAQLWANWASRFEPDVVVIYPTPAFYLSNEPPGNPRADRPSDDTPVPWHSRLVDRAHNVLHYPSFIQRLRVNRWLAADRAGRDPSWFFSTVPEERLRQFVDDTNMLLDCIIAKGATAVLVTHATAFHRPPLADERDELTAWNQFVPRAQAPVLLEFEDATASALRDLGMRRGVRVVDAASIMNGHRDWFAEDFIHFNDDGAAAMARLLADTIVRPAAPAARVPAPHSSSAFQ